MTPEEIAENIINFYKSKTLEPGSHITGIPHEDPLRKMIISYVNEVTRETEAREFVRLTEMGADLALRKMREAREEELEACAQLCEHHNAATAVMAPIIRARSQKRAESNPARKEVVSQ